MQERLLKIYQKLNECYGETNWWPGDTIDEIIVGAVLTQNTNWQNVEKSLKNLKESNLLNIKKLLLLEEDKLKGLIKPSGFYNIKAKRLKNVLFFFEKVCGGDFNKLSNIDLNTLRNELLSVKGVGKETADSILLYALNYPIFVIDAYTKRLLSRTGISNEESYDSLQKLFHENLEKDILIYKEFHALIVIHCKKVCKKKPECENCSLKNFCCYYNNSCNNGKLVG